MAGAHVQAAPHVFWRRADHLQCVLVQRLDLVVSVAGLQVVRIVVFFADFFGGEAGMRDARFVMTVDVVIGDQTFDEVFGVFGQFPKLGGIVLPNQFLKPILLHALTRAELSAVAPGGAKAHAMCL